MMKMLLDEYNSLAFTHNYIMGYTDRGNVYASFCNANLLPYVCCLDKVASNRKGGYSLRFKPTKAQKELLKTEKTIILGSVDSFENEVANSIYNRGEIFEKWVTEYHKQEWIKDNVPFTKAGDIEIDTVPYQIKFQKATFCNEVSIRNLKAKGE